MRLTIYMQDGRQYPFSIVDEREFVSRVGFWEVFDRPVLRVHDGRDTWTFNPAMIEKIHFLTDEDPPWLPPENILASKCISPESYRRKFDRIAVDPRDSKHFEEGKLIEAVLEIALASGATECFECTIMLRRRREQMLNLYRLFEKVGYPFKCETGGFILLNPRKISCIRMHPAPAEDFESAWVVDAPAEPALQ